ncbi:hypothetical protein BGX38DRAFT_285423 [Terfezia claveryi]|nr:hypothetical protein BGX38DRAFT_285423 [Terfezia claveryi]
MDLNSQQESPTRCLPVWNTIREAQAKYKLPKKMKNIYIYIQQKDYSNIAFIHSFCLRDRYHHCHHEFYRALIPERSEPPPASLPPRAHYAAIFVCPLYIQFRYVHTS